MSYKFSFEVLRFLPQCSLEITSIVLLLDFGICIKDLKPQQLFLRQGDNIQLLLTHWAVTPLVSPTCSAACDQQSRHEKTLIRCLPYGGSVCSGRMCTAQFCALHFVPWHIRLTQVMDLSCQLYAGKAEKGITTVLHEKVSRGKMKFLHIRY